MGTSTDGAAGTAASPTAASTAPGANSAPEAPSGHSDTSPGSSTTRRHPTLRMIKQSRCLAPLGAGRRLAAGHGFVCR
eukprot:7483055-Heterocapsa_arctica.AAC.1